MATLGSLKTLYDWGKEVDPNGSVSAVAEMLSQKNAIIETGMFKEGNLPTGERTNVRTGLPTSYWRSVNAGTPVSKATSAQVDFQCAQLTARSEIDRTIARLNGNTAEYRLKEGRAFIEAMSQEAAGTMLYGSAASPEEFVGLANHYNSLTGSESSDNVITAGGTGGSDYTSIYLVGWGDSEIYGIFPKGSKAGLMHEDLGLIDAFDGSNNRFRAYADYYEWNLGFCVKDWRYGVRICNIDVSDLAGLTGTQAVTAATSLTKLLSRSIDHMHDVGSVKPYFYMNRTAASHLRIIAQEKSSSAVTIEAATNQFGKNIHQLKFLGIPVGITDQITNAETEVV